MKRVLLLGAVFLLMGISSASGFVISLDPASPANTVGTITPDDVLSSGPAVSIEGSALGLADNFLGGIFDNLNALSFNDPLEAPLYFSVDRVAVGVLGTAVNMQSFPGADAAGDIFQALPPANSNTLLVDEQAFGLTPGFFGDDVDALAGMPAGPIASTYFSIDDLSNNIGNNVGGNVVDPGDIFLSNLNSLFADHSALGLNSADDLDGLVLFDRGTIGALDPGVDQALFSLSTFSPSTFTFTGLPYVPGAPGALSPSDILFTDFSGGFGLFASAGDIGLFPDDELDALHASPEPGT